MTKIYFAGPLFSQADLRYNAYLVEQIRQLIKQSIFIYHKKMRRLTTNLLMPIAK